ncbi:MAG: leucyl aminopeptidase [bacterium]|jgi:leucyl aminopeptidase|nr:leucyl aminopeptidase [bacterium]
MQIQGIAKIPRSIHQFVVFVKPGASISLPQPDLSQAALDAQTHGYFTGKSDELLPVFTKTGLALLVGVGENPQDLSARKLSKLVKTALKHKVMKPHLPTAILPPYDEPMVIRAMVEGAKLGLYTWNKYITSAEDKADYNQYSIQIQTQQRDLVTRVATICEGVNLARDLGNENADVADSVFVEQTIRTLIQHNKKCTLKVLNQKELQKEGLRLHLAVNQGSTKEPKLIIVQYQGGKKQDPYTALIGKGLTFDSGGLNLKTTGSMEDMRMDVCGAAAVIGTLQNTLALGIPRNLYFVVGLAENAIGPKSYKPGDVLISYCGKTVEIGNTDAEGRLVLADANSYIAKNYAPHRILNIATLTGAVIFALGHDYTGLMTSDERLANECLAAAAQTDDRAWQLPNYPELKEHIKSDIADIKNTGLPRQAGTLSAGEFLRQFAQCVNPNLPWAHLDIAGTAILDKEQGCLNTGASGAGVRLFTQFLINESQKEKTTIP